MSVEGQVLCYLIAFTLVGAAGVVAAVAHDVYHALLGLGLAAFILVYLWTAMEAV